MAVRAKFTSKLSTSWLAKKERNWDVIALTMATEIDRFAKVLAPFQDGNLVNSGRIERQGEADYKVAFGGSDGPVSVKYAKRRHFENKKSPHTLGYLNRAGKAVSKQKEKYIKGEKVTIK